MSANGLHRIQWRRVAVARVHRTAASQLARDLINIQQSIAEQGVENVSKRTPSDPMETGCRGKNPSDRRMSVRKRQFVQLHARHFNISIFFTFLIKCGIVMRALTRLV